MSFRSSYYAKVGFEGINVEKKLDSIFASPVIDNDTLSEVSLKYDVPPLYRLRVWQHLLGIYPKHQESVEFVWEQRKEQFELLFRSLRLMRRIKSDTEDERQFLRSIIPVMYALERDELYIETVRVTQKPPWDTLMQVVFDVAFTVTNNRASLYWLCRNISRLFLQRQALWNQLVKETEQRLKKTDLIYCNALREKGVFTEQFLSRCFQDSFGTIFSPEVTVRLWDKVIAGSNLIEAFVAAECLESLKDIESFRQSDKVDQDKFVTLLSQVSVHGQNVLLDKAVSSWMHNGRSLEVKFSESSETSLNASPAFSRSDSLIHYPSSKPIATLEKLEAI